jgi:hypothetical protein
LALLKEETVEDQACGGAARSNSFLLFELTVPDTGIARYLNAAAKASTTSASKSTTSTPRSPIQVEGRSSSTKRREGLTGLMRSSIQARCTASSSARPWPHRLPPMNMPSLDHPSSRARPRSRDRVVHAARPRSWHGRHRPTARRTPVSLPDTYIDARPGRRRRDAVAWLQAPASISIRRQGFYAVALGTGDTDAAGQKRANAASPSPIRCPCRRRPQHGAAASGARAHRAGEHAPRLAFFIQHICRLRSASRTDKAASITGIDHVVVASSDLADCARLLARSAWPRPALTIDRRKAAGCSSSARRIDPRAAGETTPAQPGARDLLGRRLSRR